MNIDFNKIKTPCYIVDEKLLTKNLEILKYVQDKTGAKILLATKAFSMFSTFGLISKYLKGVTSSSLFEARLGYEEMKGQVHIYAPAYREDEFDEIMEYTDHIIFNNFGQIKKYIEKINNNPKKIDVGIRINPTYSEIETDIYNPCYTNSRMGTTFENFEDEYIKHLDGLHFHTMCQQGADTLERTIKIVDEKFGKYIKNMKWINFGGGHHITKEGYDIEKLIKCIMFIKNKYNIDVYLEPGEAVALNAGFLVSQVLDITKNNIDIAILDVSATCHMPDVLEMPYRPEIIGAKNKGEAKYTYRLASPTCLAGDIIGDYSFDLPLKEGDKLVFCDMAIYSMVKNNTFNGINLPSIYYNTKDDNLRLIKHFGYEDFKGRLS